MWFGKLKLIYIDSLKPAAYSTYQEPETGGDLECFGANWVLGIVGGSDLVGGEEIPLVNYHLTR